MKSTFEIELSLLEEKSELWRKHNEEQSELRRKYYEEENRRIEEEYQRELVKIEEDFQRAAKRMKADFSAKMKAVLRQNSGCNVSEEAAVEPAPAGDKTQPNNDCTRPSNPNKADSSEQHSQTKPLSKKSTVPRSVINGEPEPTSHQRRGKMTKTVSADSPTADSYVSTRSLTSSIHRSNQISAKVPESQPECKTNPVQTMIFVYETSAEQFGLDQVACRVIYQPKMEQYFHHRRRRHRRRRRRHRRKEGNRHQLKTLLFDPGGYCVAAVERVSSTCSVFTTIRFDCSTVLPSRYSLMCRKALRKFDGHKMNMRTFGGLDCYLFHGGECCVQIVVRLVLGETGNTEARLRTTSAGAT
ncbi:uncharacterized protein LOC134286176 [Aedes albopictus]|uniref:Uncharacterized protein n=1 Tax=Aedes albopictus TaxID=7160 RepID=A0ABM1YFZ2_AEDAL